MRACTSRWLAVFALTAALATSPTLAQEDAAAEPTTTSFDFAFASAYVWRGVTMTDGAVFQPTTTLAFDSGLSLSFWGNLDITDANDLAGDFFEVDLTLAYALPLESKLAVEIGWIEYLFPNDVGPGTREVYVSLGVDTVLKPHLAVYYDFDEVDDYYANVGVELGRPLSPRLSWTLAVAAGLAGEDFARFYSGTDAGFFDGNLSFALTYAGERFTVGGYIAYSDTLDDTVLPEQDVDLYGGLAVGFSL